MFDADEVTALLSECLGRPGAKRTNEFFRWKHVDNPFGASISLVERDERGILIALRMFQRWGLSRSGEAIESVRAVDTATAPRAQGQGLFRKLTLKAVEVATAEEVDLVFNTPNQKSGSGYLKMGWQDLGRPGVFIRLTRPPLWGRVEGDPIEPTSLQAAAARHTVASDRLRTRTSEAYFRWRYADIPAYEYRMLSNGEATAVFRRQQRRGLPELTITELRHPDTFAGARDASRLVRDLVKHGGAFAVVAAAPLLSTTAAALMRAGFVWTPLGPRLFARHLAMRRIQRLPVSTSDWSLGVGDLELF